MNTQLIKPIISNKTKDKQTEKKNLEEAHPFLLNLLYCFFFPLICRIKQITNDDICCVQTNDSCNFTTQCIEKHWKLSYEWYAKQFTDWEFEQATSGSIYHNYRIIHLPKKPSLFKIIVTHLGGIKLLLAILIFIPSVGFQICQPSLMKEIMKQVLIKAAMPEIAKFPYASAIILILSPFLRIFFNSLGSRFLIHFASKTRSSLCGLIYKKVLLLNISAQSNINTGRIISLISNDLNQMAYAIPRSFQAITVPIQIFIPFGFVCYYWGASSLIFFGVMTILIPVQLILSQIINEALLGMRVVKMSGLENVFIQHIELSRNKQLKDIFYFTLWMQIIIATLHFSPSLVNSSTMATYIFTKDIPQMMFAVEVQPTIGFLVQETLPFSFLAFQLQDIGIVSTSLARVRDFLILPEMKKIIKKSPNNIDNAVEVINSSFCWGDPPEIPISAAEKKELQKEQEKNKKQTISHLSQQINSEYDNDIEKKKKIKSPTLKNILFTLPKGSLTMIIGSVGSGKSSIGSVLIGDIEQMNNIKDEQNNNKYNNNENQKDQLIEDIKGDVRIDGQIAYCPQIAWINNNTVRGNITFGSEYDEEKYNEVIRVCALEPDFQTLAAGDMTAIGEKGVNLSGGQKARIQLAKAVYSDRDIYIHYQFINLIDQ
ncbi:MAG: putative ABC transporter, partial [Streblomastix strix]